MPISDENPGKGNYECTKCGFIILLDDHNKKLPLCPECKGNKFNKSLIVRCVECLTKVASKLSIHECIKKKREKKCKKASLLFTEIYIIIWFISISAGFILIPKSWLLFYLLLSIASIYRLLDILIYISIAIFIDYKIDKKGYYIPTRDPRRSIIFGFINTFEIVLYFSVLYLLFGSGFCRPILDPLTAFYQSILTLTTLGYGEIHANNDISKILVISQLSYFFSFLLLILPRIFSVARVKEIIIKPTGSQRP